MAQFPGYLGASLAIKVQDVDSELGVSSFGSNLEAAPHFVKGAFDDAVVRQRAQRLLKSFNVKVAYFDTMVATGILARV